MNRIVITLLLSLARGLSAMELPESLKAPASGSALAQELLKAITAGEKISKQVSLLPAEDTQTYQNVRNELIRTHKPLLYTLLAAHFDDPAVKILEENYNDEHYRDTFFVPYCIKNNKASCWMIPSSKGFTALALNNDGSGVAVAGEDTTAHVFRLGKDGLSRPSLITTGRSRTKSLGFNNQVLIGASDHRLWSIDLQDQKTQQCSPLPPNSRLILASDGRWYIYEEKVGPGRVCLISHKPFESVSRVILGDISSFARGIKKLATDQKDIHFLMCSDRQAWLVVNDKEIRTEELELYGEEIRDLAIAPDGTYGVIGTHRACRIYPLPRQEYCRKSRIFTDGVSATALSPCKTYVLIGLPDGRVCLWDWQLDQEVTLFNAQNNRWRTLAWSGDGDTMAAASDRALYVLNTKSLSLYHLVMILNLRAHPKSTIL